MPGSDFHLFLANLSLVARGGTRSKEEVYRVIIGNEAADLDSMASSLLHGYLHQRLEPADSKVTWLPVINIPRDEFVLRTECTYVFNKCGIKTDELVFIDEIDLKSLASAATLELVIVDHNKLAPKQDYLGDYVKGILDHHKDEGLYLDAQPRIIEVVGSCTTLIISHWLSSCTSNHKTYLCNETAMLALGPILLDTINLDEHYDRVRPKDSEVAKTLIEYLIDTPMDFPGAQQYYTEIREAKFNIHHLPSRDLLRKDYKEWKISGYPIGISTVTWSLDAWLERDGEQEFTKAVESYAREHSLDLLGIMTAFENKDTQDFARQLVLYLNNDKLNDLPGRLESTELKLQKKDSVLIGRKPFYAYEQMNVHCSRKQVQPIVKDAIQSL
ncbi:DHH phosphoesterase [Basidiobolus meristosporus CBS 931.73]|uniref:DHH phosphoesterase n=1 Tax=Basidiobolus meristosporus CBS 931.73 TaxID=1314790 RepID=A0A1Y1XU20_9FUNG|nr:DHH phosphoesterase [Basidiobolus meristosporus CBS 931.73]|eukprot:ORX88784.1 DHH phosphoesterase [Basidiobolus meristosporus CBS 931.73]